MRIDEIVTLNDVLGADQYLRLLRQLKVTAKDNINVSKVKNQIIQDWKAGTKSRKHFRKMLRKIDLNLNDLIKE